MVVFPAESTRVLTETFLLHNFIFEIISNLMRNSINIKESEITDIHDISPLNVIGDSINVSGDNTTAEEILKAEGCERFKNYFERLGFSLDEDFVVLSSLHHYFYEAEEIKSRKGIINLKDLNKIKNIKNYFHSISHVLPSRGYLIGCFIDNKNQSGFSLRRNSSDYISKRNLNAMENGIISNIPFLNMLYNLMDSKTNHYMSKISVTLMLEDHGFKVINMTEQNKVTYFCARRVTNVKN